MHKWMRLRRHLSVRRRHTVRPRAKTSSTADPSAMLKSRCEAARVTPAVAGAAGGTLLTHAFQSAAAEIRRRWLSRQEEARIGGVLGAVVAELDYHRFAGRRIRTNDFFVERDGRSSAEEVIERTLLAAKGEAEERKIELLGRILAAICVDASVGRAQANNLLRVAESMTYRQFFLRRSSAAE